MTAPLPGQNPAPGTPPEDEKKAETVPPAPLPWEKEGEKFDLDKFAQLYRNLVSERDTLKAEKGQLTEKVSEAEKAKMSDLERAQTEAREAAAERDALRVENVKLKVIGAKGVPANLAKFITGSNEQEISASADELLAAINGAGNGGQQDQRNPLQTTPLPQAFSTGLNGTGTAEELDPVKLHQKYGKLS